MSIGRLISVLRTLLLRGLGSGVSVLFTVLVSRHLVTSEAALFFILFNASVIGAVCFRWGIDEVVIRRVAAAKVGDRESIAGALVFRAHRRVLFWVGAALLLGLALLLPWVGHHFGGMSYLDFSLMVIASGLIACAAVAARVLQGEGRTDAATFYLNICVPVLALVGLLCLTFIGEKISARQLLWCYLLAAVAMYAVVVPVRYGRELSLLFSSNWKGVSAEAADLVAANRLGMVVLAQQALGWSAVAIIPIFYGDSAYAGFVVSQKLATLVSLLMLAINFTFSSRFAALHAKGELQELWRLVRLSVGAILIASAAILAATWLFMASILEYARVPRNFGSIVIIMMIGQIAFSMAALFAVVLSMCQREKFLLRVQVILAAVFIPLLTGACATVSLPVASWVFVLAYSVLAFTLFGGLRRAVGGEAGHMATRSRGLDGPTSVGQLHLDIQAFKESKSASEDGLNYARVVAPYLYDTSLKGQLKLLALSFGFEVRVLVQTVAAPTHLIFYGARSKNRADYDYIVDSIRSALDGSSAYAEARDALSPVQWFRTLCRLPGSFRMTQGFSTSVVRRLVVGSLIARMRSACPRVLASLPTGHRRIITFCDAHSVENLVTQAQMARGIFAITNQHGQYRLLDDRNMSPDAEAYANFISNRMIVWGEATIREFEKAGYATDRFVVAGWIRAKQQCDTGPIKRVFGVMLNGQNGQDSNLALLSAATALAEALDLTYVVRLHPWTPLSAYRSAVDERCEKLMHASLAEYCGCVDFSLAHMSGAVVELLDQRRAVYLLDDGRLADVFRRPGLSWGSAQAIIEAVKRDTADSDGLFRRVDSLAVWYNDDTDQLDKLAEFLRN
ncbi:hypothetical protein [Stenotrophomonas sp. G4]|uniref:lipopolysaccharide biosynthesis protein n=1 Tax=Stenotrophomonas sp. G4 TaxID=2303750 RepID=UPI000E3E1D37|nr:hypothetical protein [Stenotrophomonas sp. G4]